MVYRALPKKNKPKEIVVFQCGYTTIALETANAFQSSPSHDRYLTHVSLPGVHTLGFNSGSTPPHPDISGPKGAFGISYQCHYVRRREIQALFGLEHAPLFH
jgi:hypothetical protein